MISEKSGMGMLADLLHEIQAEDGAAQQAQGAGG